MSRISVIIPALNERDHLTAAMRSLDAHAVTGIPREVIVVDCESSDGTSQIARQLGARCLTYSGSQPGKAFALNRGAKEATGDILFFLDADSIVPDGYDAVIQAVLADPKNAGGAFEFALDGPQFGLRVVECVNRLRYRIWPRYYGDQGIFTRKDLFQKIGGYPPRRMMEASHFCMALRRCGRLVLVRKPMWTSPRRFLDGGIYRVLGLDFKIWWLDLIGRPTEHFAKDYWQANQDRHRD